MPGWLITKYHLLNKHVNLVQYLNLHTLLSTSNTESSTPLTMKVFHILTLVALAGYAAADIVVENEIFNPDDIYDFVTSDDSAEDWKSTNTKKYYCTYRNLWSKIDHPYDYPQFARLSDFILYSSTTGFLPWLIARQTTVGVETLAEVSSSSHSSSSNQSLALSEYITHPAQLFSYTRILCSSHFLLLSLGWVRWKIPR
jgi:hypothetical protein